jgi:hypothetical protein
VHTIDLEQKINAATIYKDLTAFAVNDLTGKKYVWVFKKIVL